MNGATPLAIPIAAEIAVVEYAGPDSRKRSKHANASFLLDAAADGGGKRLRKPGFGHILARRLQQLGCVKRSTAGSR
jgi:hypothetical protein